MIFNTVVGVIQTELNDTTSATKTKIERWLNEAHAEICAMRSWPFLTVEESDEMSVAAAAVPYPVSSITFDTGVAHEAQWDCDEVLRIWDVTDSVIELEKVTPARLRSNFQVTTDETGLPQFWYYSRQVRADAATAATLQRYVSFYPALSETRTLVFAFTRKPKVQASGSTNVLLIPDEWSHVVYNRVLWKAWRERGDDRWADAKDDYVAALGDMKKRLSGQVIAGYNPAGNTVRSRFPLTVTS